jgi:hypothetical protein
MAVAFALWKHRSACILHPFNLALLFSRFARTLALALFRFQKQLSEEAQKLTPR